MPVAAPPLTNGSTKLNGASSTPDSVPTPSGEPVVEVATNGVSEEAEVESTEGSSKEEEEPEEEVKSTEDKEKEKEEREAKARKKELDALNEQYKDIPLGSKAELVHLDKVRGHIHLRSLALIEWYFNLSGGIKTATSTMSNRTRLPPGSEGAIGGRSISSR
jgi:hypothetical protein